MYCNSSGKSIEKLKCRVKPINRYEANFNLECDIVRPFYSIMIDVTLWHKNFLGQNFRRVANVPNVDICKLNLIITKVPFMKMLVDYINVTFNGIVHECPYQGKFKIVNASFGKPSRPENRAFINVQPLPNGIYKIQTRSYNRRDPHIHSMSLFFEIKARAAVLSQDENF